MMDLYLLDIAPTLLSVAGGNVEAHNFDGVNIIPYLQGKITGSPREAIWRESEGICWAMRTVNSKFLKRNWNDTVFEFYDMDSDPYEAINIIDKTKNRDDLLTLWNTWNEENQPNILLQSYDYQLKRQNMYEELYSDHEKKH